ncbi:phosphotransferase family protein [Halobaculum marinum]|uniref:Phosphotransferase family protein n=1 Tax=Halobaculum marinum TaxID=3031996 RepID=A0ABD5WZM7_9EURY|nr:phosphotransferase [Halobaculum sp. DT55]
MFARSALVDAVERVVSTTVTVVDPIRDGKNHSYRVAGVDGDEFFLKVGTRFPDAFPAEPAAVDLVRARTDVPLPTVRGTGRDPLGVPYAVFDYVPGVDADGVASLPDRAARRLCREAGEHLAAIHRIRFDAVGGLGVVDGAVAVTRERDYRTLLGASLERQVEDLRGSRFADVCDRVAEAGAALVDDLDLSGVSPALVHGDYRLDNLRVDPTADRVTVAVVDWELPSTADPLWDAVMALALLTEGHDLSPTRRRTLRAAFRDGYEHDGSETESAGAFPTDAADRLLAYELLARARLMRHLDAELPEASERVRDARAREHRALLDDLLDGHRRLTGE